MRYFLSLLIPGSLVTSYYEVIRYYSRLLHAVPNKVLILEYWDTRIPGYMNKPPRIKQFSPPIIGILLLPGVGIRRFLVPQINMRLL